MTLAAGFCNFCNLQQSKRLLVQTLGKQEKEDCRAAVSVSEKISLGPQSTERDGSSSTGDKGSKVTQKFLMNLG